ncbi:MAG: hypothetical protein H6810_04905 [Phycisphaeraceae bacterium]|nr:MAG: hypothetical protein H6810_04905 [Phycisphaeraceae bacterium]
MVRITAACLLAAAGLANAESVVLTIDNTQSNISVNATLDTPVGSDSDSAFSTVSGTIEVELDDYGAPAAITLHDFIIALDSNIALHFDYGFLGSADANLLNAMAMYANPGTPVGPVGLAGSAFSFADVPTVLGGTYSYSYSFFLVGSDNGSGNLADFGVLASPISGNITSDGTTVTLSGTLAIDGTQNVIPGIADLTLTGSATLVATGEAPQPQGCNAADIAEPFGVLDLADIGAFVTAFLAHDPAADIAPPAGVFDLADLQAFISAFTGGCP